MSLKIGKLTIYGGELTGTGMSTGTEPFSRKRTLNIFVTETKYKKTNKSYMHIIKQCLILGSPDTRATYKLHHSKFTQISSACL